MERIIEKEHKNLSIDKSIEEGLWRTGKNKYIVIQNIDDPVYLEKILRTLLKRIHFIEKEYIEKSKTQFSLLIQIVDQIKDIGSELELIDYPFAKVDDDKKLSYYREYFLNNIKIKEKKCQPDQSEVSNEEKK